MPEGSQLLHGPAFEGLRNLRTSQKSLGQILLRNRIPWPFRIPINPHAPPPLAIIEKFHTVDPAVDRFSILGLSRFVGRINMSHRAIGIGLPAELMLKKSMLQKIF